MYTNGVWRETGSLHFVLTAACSLKLVICAVNGCCSGSTKGIHQGVKFFQFLKAKHTLKWILPCRQKDEVKVKSAWGCSKIFPRK